MATKSSLVFYDAKKVEEDARQAGRSVTVWKDEDEWTVGCAYYQISQFAMGETDSSPLLHLVMEESW